MSACFFWVCTAVSADYTQEEDFQYADAAEKACHDGKLSDDILKEQDKLKEADLVIFQVEGLKLRRKLQQAPTQALSAFFSFESFF